MALVQPPARRPDKGGMRDLEACVWLAGGILGGLALFGAGFRAWRRLRLIEDTPTSRVRSMALGRVELAGSAVGKADLEAPFTGTPCVYYRYRCHINYLVDIKRRV